MKKVACLLFAYYPQDVRARRECEALAEAGMEVDVISLKLDGQQEEATFNGVRIHRLAMQKLRAEKFSYLTQYARFLVRSLVKLSLLHVRARYDCIHVHNMPDILVFAAALPKLTGSKILLDLRDPMPELFMTKFSVNCSHPFIRLLILLERLSVGFADVAITPNLAFRDLFISRGCPQEKISIVMNAPPEPLFSAVAAPQPVQKKFVVMFHGTIVERHGIDTALAALAALAEEIPELEFRLFGEGDFNKFEPLVRKYHLEDVVRYYGAVPWERIPGEIASCDLGIIPNKKTPFTELNLPGRIFEYLSLGKPVIVPRSRGILDYFHEGSILFFEAGSAESLAGAIREVHADSEGARRVVAAGMAVYQQHRWEVEKRSFVNRVAGLVGGVATPDRQPVPRR